MKAEDVRSAHTGPTGQKWSRKIGMLYISWSDVEHGHSIKLLSYVLPETPQDSGEHSGYEGCMKWMGPDVI